MTLDSRDGETYRLNNGMKLDIIHCKIIGNTGSYSFLHGVLSCHNTK